MTNDIFLIRLGAILQHYFQMRPGYKIIYMPRSMQIKYYHNERVNSIEMKRFLIDKDAEDDILAAYVEDANVLFVSLPEQTQKGIRDELQGRR